MSQLELDQPVARATGETRRTVRQLGFSVADPLDVTFDPEPSLTAKYLDWDDVAADRHARLAVH